MITIEKRHVITREIFSLFPGARAFSTRSLSRGVFGRAPRRVMCVVAMDIAREASWRR
tara:strand:+ start:221 stop:394 length:174 start_codon:yes stop_codon:yes gene_type:complete